MPETQFLLAAASEEKPKSFKETFLLASNNRKFELIRDGISKLRSSDKPSGSSSNENESKIVITASSTGTSSSLKVGIAKMFTKWKTEADDATVETEEKSFTQKRGVMIDPINVFGLRRDQSLDSATRRGLFHK